MIKKGKKTTHTPLGNSVWPLPGHTTALLLALATQRPHLPPPGAQSCSAMGGWPGALVMGTWRNANPHPLIVSTGYKAQSQQEHHLLRAGPTWSHVTLPQLLPPICSITPCSWVPCLDLVPKRHQNNHHLLSHQLCTKAMHRQLRGSHPLGQESPRRTARPPQTAFGARTRSNNEFPQPA